LDHQPPTLGIELPLVDGPRLALSLELGVAALGFPEIYFSFFEVHF
jgi:hypothetical protein